MVSCADSNSEQRVADGNNIILADFFSVNGNFPALVIGDRGVNNAVLSGVQRAGYLGVGKALDIQRTAVELVVALNEFVSIKTVDKEVLRRALQLDLGSRGLQVVGGQLGGFLAGIGGGIEMLGRY